jgi:Skp family chaperone for outer membrane proteins
MNQLSRQEFTDKVQEYIKRINQIAEEQGYSVMMAYYIG